MADRADRFDVERRGIEIHVYDREKRHGSIYRPGDHGYPWAQVLLTEITKRHG